MSDYRIFKDGNNDIAEFEIDKTLYTFAIDYVPEKLQGWFMEVVNSKFEMIHRRAYQKGRNDVQKALQEALGLGKRRPE